MHRFFVSKSFITESSVNLSGDDVKHITRVLRLTVGDNIMICDGEGTDYLCSISECGKDFVIADIIEKTGCKTESKVKITLYQGLPKGDKMDYIVQKCVELGVCKIVPVVMKRTVVKVKEGSNKNARWQRIAEEAAKQSERGIIPIIGDTISYSDMLDSLGEDSLTILAYENEKTTSLKNVLSSCKTDKINIIIGPEGGFEEQEVLLAQDRGSKVVTLGNRILRCETAPVALVSAVMYELDW